MRISKDVLSYLIFNNLKKNQIELFIKSCKSFSKVLGKYQKKFLSKIKEIGNENNIQYIFEQACKNGDLDIAKYYNRYFKNENSDSFTFRFRFDQISRTFRCTTPHFNKSEAFTSACNGGHQKIAKWLLKNFEIDLEKIIRYNLDSFKHSNIKKWLKIG